MMRTMEQIRKEGMSISSIKTITKYPPIPDKKKFAFSHIFLFENDKIATSTGKKEDISTIRNSLKEKTGIDELMIYGKSVFPDSKKYLFDLMAETIEVFSNEEGEKISVESFKGMLLFLYLLIRFKEPEISISECGIFYLDWEEEMNHSLTVRFKDDFFLEYSLFQPSDHPDKWNIKNGNVHVLDFHEDLSGLGIKLHKEP